MRSSRRIGAVLVAAAAAAWFAGLVAAPLIAAGGGAGPTAWASAIAYRAGSVICHQQDARSLHLAGVRMPVCARCAGLYAGGALGALAAFVWIAGAPGFRRVPLGRARAAAVACGAPTLLAWAAEHAGGLGVPGGVRAALAAPLGAAIAAILTLWAGGADFDDTPPSTALH